MTPVVADPYATSNDLWTWRNFTTSGSEDWFIRDEYWDTYAPAPIVTGGY